ncbi:MULTISPECIES: DUF4337 domain-containing protein [unclassified Undibacterium]|uniref:DUF4337 domain-containing protein n=1 Tax=unclassified Undibacterium TaxID=2630295 RepID=UPI002AC9EB0E|nr:MULTISPECIES: DUF4337 domain-containing protein [unclassified Undibacterium]MEB0138766.1 DUF4337 domain-containing protein [Undibacterium sp. CCC2.1]MEB0170758.1 DUF4337 domain-containing protein [Undibacterium sp. CCC1.1]MEB0174647.1 DUF4337 domain-containing protein [Undibacterium sp. CCC3.4]MEB0213844.1 DUF4337 domain-containing protein [Undibacterium sp. 5I2]WPX42570.1 DUF4337 domain-containing protein [Undibacterium sp. CCC3.4]
MSSDEFHVHGPHDHEVEHAAAHGNNDFAGRIAVMTAILATVGALFGYEGGATQNDAAMLKNDAAIRKTEASNQWNFYQSKSSKQNLAELAMVLPGADSEKYKSEVARYKSEKEDIKKKAEELEAQSSHFEELSEQALHQHHRWAQAMTAIQIAISLAAMTLLTKKKWLQLTSYGAAGIGVLLAALAALHI